MRTKFHRIRNPQKQARRKSVGGNADWSKLYGQKPQDMRTLPFGIEPERKP